MREGDCKMKNTIFFLIIMIILVGATLLGFLFYDYHLNSLEKTQSQTKDMVLGAIIYQIQQQGYVEIIDINGNKLVLIPYIP